MRDILSQQRLSVCHPALIGRVTAAADELEQQHNITIRISEGLRSYAQSNADYAQGRTVPGHIITDAPGGYSAHNPLSHLVVQSPRQPAGASLCGSWWGNRPDTWGNT